MRPDQGNPLDLNNLPEDFSRDAKQTSGDSSSSAGGYRKKKSGGAKEGKDEAGKVYECRFCSLKFCKSQALGGHMNRHRQERETETLNKARELVFTNDLAPSHVGYVSSSQPIQQGGYHHQASNSISMYPTRVFSSSPLIPSPAPPPQAPSPFMYPSPPQLLSFPSQYPTAPSANDYFVGHVLNSEGNYTCIGAPVGHRFGNSGGDGGGGGGGGDWRRR